ncbi:MAG: helix-turn-helix domain-containing protein [Desulfomonilaceae bacterium]
MERLLRLTEISKLTGISRWTIRYWLRQGKGPAYGRSPGGHFRFRENDVLAWYMKLGEQPLPECSKCALAREETDIEPFMSIGKAAKMVGVSKDTLRSWTEKGQGPDYKRSPRGHFLFRKSDIIRWLNSLPGSAMIEMPESSGREAA